MKKKVIKVSNWQPTQVGEQVKALRRILSFNYAVNENDIVTVENINENNTVDVKTSDGGIILHCKNEWFEGII